MDIASFIGLFGGFAIIIFAAPIGDNFIDNFLHTFPHHIALTRQHLKRYIKCTTHRFNVVGIYPIFISIQSRHFNHPSSPSRHLPLKIHFHTVDTSALQTQHRIQHGV